MPTIADVTLAARTATSAAALRTAMIAAGATPAGKGRHHMILGVEGAYRGQVTITDTARGIRVSYLAEAMPERQPTAAERAAEEARLLAALPEATSDGFWPSYSGSDAIPSHQDGWRAIADMRAPDGRRIRAGTWFPLGKMLPIRDYPR